MKVTKKIKFTYPFPNWPIDRQLPKKSMVLDNYEFFINDASCTDPDFWVIFDGLLRDEKANCKKDNTVFFTAEPPSFKKYNHDFLQQFGHVITCQRNINHPNIHYFHQGHPWFVGKSYDELISRIKIPKSKNISVITSDKQITDGHKKRFDFCHQLKEHFGDDVDLFGRGIKDFEDKWDVLAPYRYSVAIENEYLDDWFTEKLYDCFLAHTVPIYYGCPNLKEYFDPNSFSRININNIKESFAQVDRLLESRYEDYILPIEQAKIKYLNKYNLFFLIINKIEEIGQQQDSQESVILHTESFFEKKQSKFQIGQSILSLWNSIK
ncbi:MAG: glycosyltransferase family 10 [Reichenbachiella sp.]|uniref:glycosyltransferase family 10 domain-containing protein n=1 Tax=Reichenbachiella sp. TaxID=2184521 RepID=UPI0032639392